jgi:hypothetical protein
VEFTYICVQLGTWENGAVMKRKKNVKELLHESSEGGTE